jgi:AcrR family transcriptional regulator
MARSSGTRNADYAATRANLLKAIRTRLLTTGSDQVSFREMAEHAAVSVPTLRHYFGSRNAIVQEVFAEMRREGLRYLQAASTSGLDFKASMQQAADAVLAGARFGRMDKVHSLGLTEGLGDGELGPSYLKFILEPSLQAIEHRLEVHRQREELNAASTRHAALAFAAPLLLAILHQSGLGGDSVRPLDLADFAKDHVEAFALAYGAPPPTAKKKKKKRATKKRRAKAAV